MVSMLYVILVIAALCLAGVLVMVFRHERVVRAATTSRDEWAVSRQACEEDLQRVSLDVAARDPGGSHATADLREQLRRAEQLLASAAVPDDLMPVTQTLAQVRRELDVVTAQALGDRPPARRPLCFFNPHHGVAQTRAAWTSPQGSRVHVPCCAADARRLSEGADAYVRTMKVGSVRVAWWLVPQCRPWAQGWFADWADQPIMTQLIQAAPMLGAQSPADQPLGRRAG